MDKTWPLEGREVWVAIHKWTRMAMDVQLRGSTFNVQVFMPSRLPADECRHAKYELFDNFLIKSNSVANQISQNSRLNYSICPQNAQGIYKLPCYAINASTVTPHEEYHFFIISTSPENNFRPFRESRF